jgi:transcriptional regulator with XRE-family HTH domain
MMLPATVNIDGNAVRRIREANKLTQLYVAKVVGVTTDTISRWENNRYPSIKRENVLRLAEALETDVENILQQSGPETTPPVTGRQRSPWLLPLFFLLIFIAIAGILWLGRKPALNQTLGERVLPIFAAPGAIIPVWINVASSVSGKGYIVREKFPAGWKLIEAIPPASSLDNVEGVARWIVKPGEDRLKVAYLVKAAEKESLGTNRDFAGEIIAKNNIQNNPAKIGGFVTIAVAPYVWADSNGDQVVDDGEMLQASNAYDEMNGVHLDWSLLEKIWDAGGYVWDSQHKLFKPAKSQEQIP